MPHDLRTHRQLGGQAGRVGGCVILEASSIDIAVEVLDGFQSYEATTHSEKKSDMVLKYRQDKILIVITYSRVSDRTCDQTP